MISRRRLLLFASVLAAIAPAVVRAQRKRARVGWLAGGPFAASPHIADGFKKRMQELGWVEGTSIEYLFVSSDGYADRLDALARQLVEEKVDLILAGPPGPAVAARRATGTIPIVMANVPDPVALGLVASLARPGGNVTGVSSQTTALVAKQIELLKEILPSAKRIGLLYNEKNPSATAFREIAAKAAAAARVTLVPSVAIRPEDLGAAVHRLAKESVQAVAVPADPMMLGARRALNDVLATARLPAAFANRDHALEGALLSYAPNILENFRLAAGYVDRILKGADPAKLPVEQSNKIELLLNMKTAKALGLAVPQSVLLRADQVIE
ncbi:MAG: ABC transporter substrate-binding protein [Burkholderiales bacterium]